MTSKTMPGPHELFTLPRGEVVLRGTAIGDGPPVLFLHAGRERRSVWSAVAAELRRRTPARCLLLDQRGHGESTGTIDRLTPFADDAAAVVRWIGAPTAIVGTSLGGLAAVGALRNAELRASVVGVVLVDIVPNPDPTPVWAFLSQSGLLPTAAPLAVDILGQGVELQRSLRRFGGPVLLVRGERSAISDDDLRCFRAAHPRACLETIPGAGHLVARDQPVRLGRLLSEVLPSWWA